jgi:hypothetical protein
MNEARARYDKPMRAHTDRVSAVSRPPELPPEIEAADARTQIAFLMQDQQPSAEVDEDAYGECGATLDEVLALGEVTARYQPQGGREPIYAGRDLFALLLPNSPAVRAAFTLVKCRKYMSACNDRAWQLAEEKAAAKRKAEADAFETVKAQNENAAKLANELLNSGRSAEGIAVLPPPPPDYTAAGEIQREIDGLALQIEAARRREQGARNTLGTALGDLAAAGAVLYHGVLVDFTGYADLTEHRQAYDTIARLAGDERAGEMWATFEARWRSEDGRSWKTR